MTGCIYKRDDGRCDKAGKYMAFCIGEACTHQTPSNYDRIVSMTPEELAKHICCPYEECIDLDAVCDVCVLSWLKSPVEPGEVDNGNV